MSDASVRTFTRNDAVWARRRNAFGFWLRLAVMPALGATLWFREQFDPGFLLVALGLCCVPWLSERFLPADVDGDGWAQRAVDGERLFSKKDVAAAAASRTTLRTLTWISTIGTIVMVSGAIVVDAGLTIAGGVIMLVAKIVYFDRIGRAATPSPAKT